MIAHGLEADQDSQHVPHVCASVSHFDEGLTVWVSQLSTISWLGGKVEETEAPELTISPEEEEDYEMIACGDRGGENTVDGRR